MKKKLLIALSVVLVSINGYSQEDLTVDKVNQLINESNTKILDKLKQLQDSQQVQTTRQTALLRDTIIKQSQAIAEALSDTLDSLQSKQNASYEYLKDFVLKNDADHKERIGELIYLDNTPPIYFDSKKNQESKAAGTDADIDSIKILVRDGYMLSIDVYTKTNGVFTNRKCPIEISPKRINEKKDRLFKNEKDSSFIYLPDILRFAFNLPFTPDNTAPIILKGKQDAATNIVMKYPLYKSVGINSMFEMRLFSDFFGIIGKANGIAQTEASYKQIVNKRNVPEVGWYFANYVKVNLVAAKFDSKVFLTKFDNKYSRSDLFRRSWVTADVAINHFKVLLTSKSFDSFFNDAGAGFSVSQLVQNAKGNYDTAIPYDTTFSVSPYLFWDAGFEFFPSSNTNFTLSNRIMTLYSPMVNNTGMDGGRWFFRPEFSFYWHPPANPNSKVFFRGNWTCQYRDAKNSFIQLQFGYSLTLSGLMKNNKS